MPRRTFSNVAYPVYLVGTLDGTSTSNTISVSTEPGGTATAPPGWPASYPFFAVIDPDTPSEEIVSVTGGSGGTLTITRGGSLGAAAYGTATKSHQSGAKMIHAATAADFDEANGHVNASAQVHGLAAGSSVVGTTDTQSLTNKTLAAPTLTGTTTAATITASGDVTAPNLTGAWSDYTPTWTSTGTGQPALGNGTLVGRFKVVGRTVQFTLRLTIGSTSTFGDGNWLFGLPVNDRAQPWIALAQLEDVSVPTRHTGAAGPHTVGNVFVRNYAGAAASGTAPWTWAAGDIVTITGTYEAA